MIDQMYLMLYNLVFTSLPPMAIGVFDQDATDTILMEKPILYQQGSLGQVYKRHSFWINMADALYQSLIIYFFAVGVYRNSDVGIWEFGTVICTQCLLAMTLHLAIETKSWVSARNPGSFHAFSIRSRSLITYLLQTIIHWSSIILSVFVYFLFGLLYNGVCAGCVGLQNPFWVMQHMMGTSEFWLVSLISSVTAVLPR